MGPQVSEPLGNLALTKQKLAAHAPNLAKIVANFGGCPQMKAYLARRSQRSQAF